MGVGAQVDPGRPQIDIRVVAQGFGQFADAPHQFRPGPVRRRVEPGVRAGVQRTPIPRSVRFLELLWRQRRVGHDGLLPIRLLVVSRVRAREFPGTSAHCGQPDAGFADTRPEGPNTGRLKGTRRQTRPQGPNNAHFLPYSGPADADRLSVV